MHLLLNYLFEASSTLPVAHLYFANQTHITNVSEMPETLLGFRINASDFETAVISENAGV